MPATRRFSSVGSISDHCACGFDGFTLQQRSAHQADIGMCASLRGLTPNLLN